MSSPDEAKGSGFRVQGGPRNRWLYSLLLGIQSVGAVFVYSNGVPIYRQMVGDFDNYQRESGILLWEAAAVALLQSGYWLRIRVQPTMPAGGHVFLGHVAYFGARLNFAFASASFTVMFLVRFNQLAMPPHRMVVILALLFSMFCYTLELERLAKALRGDEANT